MKSFLLSSSLFLLLTFTLVAVVKSQHSFLRTPQLLSLNENDGDDDDDYKKLITCLFNGTDVAKCHQLGCFWCHSSVFSLCVTNQTAWNMDGSYFQCEGVVTTDDDDDAAPSADDDDDDAVTTDDDTAPTEDDDDTATTDDDTAPTTDDDQAPDDDHTSEWHYFDDLMKCLNHTKADCGGATKTPSQDDDDLVCVWCHASGMTGECLSEEAADNMEGPIFTCDRNSTTTKTMG
eukprot:CAMPEP_0194029338 /NCGR_PEP_ID=MMETSP0009_2-20130614/3086_1 /TAXON_ID=210454 /ORGANISM="Grammatophora oceanica, Strain CCMP 410" /LENGTH=232 /DNA_ID=CAMNT_0038668969 /DNA_START=28 /DNA_END=726 /DNA_ORIENTATION=+